MSNKPKADISRRSRPSDPEPVVRNGRPAPPSQAAAPASDGQAHGPRTLGQVTRADLQSNVEELETSREELQSLNEELTTLNNQLHTKVDELKAVTNDLENLLASSDLATVFLDREFRIRRFTPAMRRLFNLLPADIGRPIADLAPRFRDDTLLRDAEAVLTTLKPAEAEVRADDGFVYLRRVLPYRTDQHRIDGVVITLMDISARVAAEKQQAQLAAIVASSSDAIISKTLEGRILTWNAGAERMFGYPAAEAVGRPITMLIPRDRQDEEGVILGRVARGERVEHFETVRLARDGKLVDVSLTISPIVDADGRIVGASKIARDIAETKAAEKRQLMLMRELDHRVKNTLAVVASLASQTIVQSRSLEEFGPAFEGRVLALARAHNLLSQTQWNGATIEKLIRQVVKPVSGNGDRCVLHGEDLMLPPRVAVSLAMVLHELATNAAKYGALSIPGGRVDVSWRDGRDDDGRTLDLEWAEHDGPPITEPPRAGFGTNLVHRSVEYDLKGNAHIDYSPDGLRCELTARWTNDTF